MHHLPRRACLAAATAVAITSCTPDRTSAPVAVASPSVQVTAVSWTLSAIQLPGTGGGVGEAIRPGGLVVGGRVGEAFSAPPTGTGVLLPRLSGHTRSHAYDVNEISTGPIAVGYSGELEGQSPNRPVFWRLNAVGVPLSVTNIGLPTGLKGAIARGINNSGTIVGYGFLNPGPPFSAWMRSANGVLSVIQSVGVTAAVAEDINDGGTVVGTSTRTNGTVRAFRWPVPSGEFTIMQPLSPLAGGSESNGQAVNRKGTVVGYSVGPNAIRVAVKWNAGSTVAVDLGVGPNSEAREINEAGYILVRRPSPLGGREIGIKHPNGTLDILPLATAAGFYEAWGLNACGDVVGSGPTSASQPASQTAIRWKAAPCLP